jgi:hypothetical protein
MRAHRVEVVSLRCSGFIMSHPLRPLHIGLHRGTLNRLLSPYTTVSSGSRKMKFPIRSSQVYVQPPTDVPRPQCGSLCLGAPHRLIMSYGEKAANAGPRHAGELARLPLFASHLPFSPPWLSQIKLSKSVEKVRGYNTRSLLQCLSASRCAQPIAPWWNQALEGAINRKGAHEHIRQLLKQERSQVVLPHYISAPVSLR